MSSKDQENNEPHQLILAGIFGLIFGALLQKGGVAKYDVLLGALLLRDATVAKVILSAILTGMIGIFLLERRGMIQPKPKPTRYGANVVGGLIFGAGFALYGYCPGTGAAAIGQGNLDALVGVAGLLIGSYIYAEFSGPLSRTVETWGTRGKLILPDLLHVRKGPLVAALSAIIALILLMLNSSIWS